MVLRLLFLLLVLLVVPAQATIWIDDDFERPLVETAGWDFAAGWCRAAGSQTRVTPCPEIDISTESPFSGSRSIKMTYNAAWSDPNPQTHTQAIFWRLPGGKEDIYLRYYKRTVGFQYTANTGTKLMYYKTTQQTSAGGASPTFFSIYWWGSREQGSASQLIAQTCPRDQGAGGIGPYDSCNLYPNIASVQQADNQWYCIEEHIKMNTPGVANGLAETWINGTQTVGYYNVMFRGTDPNHPSTNSSLTKIDFIEIYKQNGHGLMYIDKWAAGDQRIGCTGTPPVTPPSDTTPPSAPSGLTSTGQTQSSIALQWTNGVDAVSTNMNARLYACTGVSCSPTSLLSTLGVTGGGVSTFTDQNLPASTTRCYRVQNVDEAGNAGAFSSTVCAATTAPPVAQEEPVTLATVTFDTDESPLSNGSTFDGGYTGFGNLDVVNGGVRPSVLGTRGLMSYNDQGAYGDQSCEWTVTTFTGSVLTEQGCALMMADAPTATLYLAKAILNGSATEQIIEYANGTPTTLAGGVGTTWVNGDRGRFESKDGQVRLYKNGVLQRSAADSTLTSGKPGLYAYTASGGGAGSITVDSAASKTQDSVSSITWNHTTGSGSNRVLEVCVGNRSSTARTFSSLTYNGVALTQVYTQDIPEMSALIGFYRLIDPPVGTYPLVLTLSGAVTHWAAGASLTLFGADQTTPIEASNTRNSNTFGQSATISGSVTTLTANAWAVDCVGGSADPPMTVGSGQTQRVNIAPSGGDVFGVSTRTVASPGSQAMTWTQSFSQYWASGVASTKPAGGSDVGDLSQNVMDGFAVGTWQAAGTPPVITGLTCDLTGCNLTYGGTTPAYVRILIGSNTGNPLPSDIEYPIASLPDGRYSVPGGSFTGGYNFLCAFARDANHVESTAASDYRCVNISALTQTDTTAPVLTPGAPHGQTITITDPVLSITSDELAEVRIEPDDVAFESMTYLMTTVDQINFSFAVPGPLSNGTYTWYACGRDLTVLQNACSVRTPITFTVDTGGSDTEAPTAPANLSCTSMSSSQATCTFDASTDNEAVTGYRATIGSGTPCTPQTIINPGWSTSTTQLLSGLVQNTAYCLIAQGLDAAGNVSPASNVSSFTTPAGGDTAPPSNVRGCGVIAETVDGANVLVVTCLESTDNIAIREYLFEACEGDTCTDWASIGTASTPTINHSGPVAGETWSYRAKAVDVFGNVSVRYSVRVVATTSDSGWSMDEGFCRCRGKRR